MAELLGIGKRFAILTPRGVRFRECLVPEVGRFSKGGIMFEVLDRDLIKAGDWSRTVNVASGSEKEEIERTAGREDKEVSLCLMM
jgi:hypothetical protein